jgi:integrating conjugative element protein (TIGR03752 family)
MTKNTGLKLLTGSILLVVILVLLNSHSNHTSVIDAEPNPIHEDVATQFNDNLREVAARLQETEKKLKAMHEENRKQASALVEIPDNKGGQQDKVNAALQEGITQLRTEVETLQEEKTTQSYPMKPEEASKSVDATSSTDTVLSSWNPIQPHLAKTQTHTPYYTIPAGSDFGRVTLLSALIGEVPSEGKLMQPLFPFSAVIHRGDLMAANGVPLSDELAGMKISGYAIGVGSFLDNISCVRAYVTSALFVFEDGHFVTAGNEEMQHSTELLNNESLGYLTTEYGNPCIQGKYITNAPQVMRAFMAAGGIQGAGAAISDWQMSYLGDSSNGIMKNPTGSLAHYAAGGALNQSTMKVSDWIEKRLQGSFDLVYVPASLPNAAGKGFHPNTVNLHITKTIPLDKENNGRMLDYGHQQTIQMDNNLE